MLVLFFVASNDLYFSVRVFLGFRYGARSGENDRNVTDARNVVEARWVAEFNYVICIVIKNFRCSARLLNAGCEKLCCFFFRRESAAVDFE